ISIAKLLRGLRFGISLRPPLTPPSADGENANAQAAAVACAPATGDVEFGISKYKLQKSINQPSGAGINSSK
ncbi:MAG: hypothetical protein WC198_09325, partial [Victivallaceae bacterium]